MKSRIFTPHNPDSQTAIAALRLRNDNAPFGMGALIASVLAAQTVDVSAFIHSNGVVEVTNAQPALDDYLMHGNYEQRKIIGSGDLRAKTLSVVGDSYTVESIYDETSALNAVSALVAKPVAPTYTILGAVNDICDMLDDIQETNPFTAWTVVVNQEDQTIVVLLHNGFSGIGGGFYATLFNAAGGSLAAIADTPVSGISLIDRFVGVVPSTGGGTPEVRPSWE